MAYADYTHCAVCDVKVFYDAEVDYGVSQYGDHKSLCAECNKTHIIVIQNRILPS